MKTLSNVERKMIVGGMFGPYDYKQSTIKYASQLIVRYDACMCDYGLLSVAKDRGIHLADLESCKDLCCIINHATGYFFASKINPDVYVPYKCR